jgi:hypothetical protein
MRNEQKKRQRMKDVYNNDDFFLRKYIKMILSYPYTSKHVCGFVELFEILPVGTKLV